MPTVAEQLRAGRETKNLTIPQVAEATKIRTDHIRALEEGDFNMFSAPVYIRGFVRNYAILLKLDVPQIMASLNDELGQTEKFKEPPPLVEQPKTPLDHLMDSLAKLNWRTAVVGITAVVVVILIVLSAIAWQHHRRSQPVLKSPPAVYQSTNAGDTLPLPRH